MKHDTSPTLGFALGALILGAVATGVAALWASHTPERSEASRGVTRDAEPAEPGVVAAGSGSMPHAASARERAAPRLAATPGRAETPRRDPAGAHLREITPAREFGSAEQREAELWLELRAVEQSQGPATAQTARALSRLASFYAGNGEPAEAETLLEEALAVDEEVHGPLDPTVANDLLELGHLHFARQQYPAATTALLRSLEIEEHLGEGLSPKLLSGLYLLAIVARSEGNDVDAGEIYRRAIGASGLLLGEEHAMTQRFEDAYANFNQTQPEQ